MEALDLAALVGAVFLLLIVIRGAMLPRDYEVARMITLELDVVKVWPLMVDPRQMNSWRSDLRRVMRVPGERDLPAWIDVGVISRRNWRATELVAFKLVRATVENGLFPMRGEARIEITGNEARTIVVFREKGRIDSQFVRVLARWAIGLHSQPDAFLRALCRKFDQPAKITDVEA
ncbi:MAG: hypothetical protein H6747_01695 [Deltaproteobacteria bacterium]|nr:hypothetical protein [Deltaproteobacteria bacterium]